MEGFEGKAVLVTGGFVGSAVAEAFLKSGANIAFVYGNPNRLPILSEKFTSYHNAFLPIRADLSDFAQAKHSVETANEKFGGVDILMNALGGWLGGKKLHEHSPSDLSKMLSMDAIPTFNIMSAVLPVMMERRSGKVINFISTQIFGSGAQNAIYSASKSAVLAFTKAAAEEYKSYGISAYAIAPSTIDTESNRKAMPKADSSRWVGIEEIVDAVLYLCRTGRSSSGTIIKFLTK